MDRTPGNNAGLDICLQAASQPAASEQSRAEHLPAALYHHLHFFCIRYCEPCTSKCPTLYAAIHSDRARSPWRSGRMGCLMLLRMNLPCMPFSCNKQASIMRACDDDLMTTQPHA